MNIKKFKPKIKVIATALTSFLLMIINTKSVMASSTIGVQEVETATQNIKDAVIEIAMPIRNCSYVCKYSNYCN